jgi:hypothetical protein
MIRFSVEWVICAGQFDRCPSVEFRLINANCSTTYRYQRSTTSPTHLHGCISVTGLVRLNAGHRRHCFEMPLNSLPSGGDLLNRSPDNFFSAWMREFHLKRSRQPLSFANLNPNFGKVANQFLCGLSSFVVVIKTQVCRDKLCHPPTFASSLE